MAEMFSGNVLVPHPGRDADDYTGKAWFLGSDGTNSVWVDYEGLTTHEDTLTDNT
jgi:hypothetical protein